MAAMPAVVLAPKKANTSEQYAIFYWWKGRLETVIADSRAELNRLCLNETRLSEHRFLQNVSLGMLQAGNPRFDPLYQLPQPREGDFAVMSLTEMTVRPVTVAWSIDEPTPTDDP